MAGAIHADATGRHRLEQGALGAGAGSIDLIGQQHLAEQGPGLKAELRRAGIEHIDTGEIRRQQVTGEADALEGQGRSPGQGLGQGGFAHPRPVLNQKMASGQQTGERQAHLLLLAQQHLRDGLHQPWQCWIKQGTHPRAQPLTFTLILERKWLAGIGTV